MVKLIDAPIAKAEVSLTRAGTPNPLLVPIVEKIIERIDNDEFTVVECEDKKELERTRESLRNRLKGRGYRVSAASATKTVKVKKKGQYTGETKTKILLYMAAYSPVKEPARELVENGTAKRRSKSE